MLQISCKSPAAIFKIQIPADTKSKFNTFASEYRKNMVSRLEICHTLPHALHNPN